jgi:hypothetical protein
MQDLLDDRELLARLSATALAKVGRLQADAVVERIERVYRDVLREAAGGNERRMRTSSGEATCP